MSKLILNGLWRLLLLGLVMFSSVTSFGAPLISELMAAHDAGLKDEDGEFSDWIEIHNPETVSISLAGYFLTDDPGNLKKWGFPAITLDPGAYLVLFASGKNRTDPAGRLHTNFQLSTEGEYLGLTAPDGITVVSAYASQYPPQFENVSFGLSGAAAAWTFFSSPTPGTPNGSGSRAGPIVQVLEANPPQPAAGPLTIAARVTPVNSPVLSVKLYYRRMHAAETLLSMKDDGLGADVQAGDRIWTAVIPATALAPGEMTRWRLVATDNQVTETKAPAYRVPLDSPQYFGTVAKDDRIKTALPVLHWFTTNAASAGTAGGSRGAVYYDGEFYDNVLFTVHGQSSSGFPKKSYNLDFNRTQRFRWSRNAPRVADIDLLSNWADKSKVRHVLAYEVMRQAGVAAHFAFTVRVQQNGSFFSTADLVEDADEIYLERAGLNKEGALYKVYNNLLNLDAGNTATSGVEKKTRKFEGNSDLQALIKGLDLTGSALERYLYDNIDIPRCVNMLAANSVIRNIDMHSKNWYIYCDTGRSGEWAMLPWDLDLSFGRVWNEQNTYFDNALYTDGFVVTGTSIRLVSHLFANSSIRAMILRRIRTLSDQFLQPLPATGTPESELYMERRMNEQSALIDPPAIVPSDARLDFEKWGSWVQGGARVSYTSTNTAVETMAEAILRFKNEYLPTRRRHIYNTQITGRGGEIPLSQIGSGPTTNYTPLVVRNAPVNVLVPANGNLGMTWTGHPASEPFNTAGWISGTTGVGYERSTGYEALIGTDINARMQSNNSVYLRIEFSVTDPTAFDRLQLRMKYDDGFAAYLNGVLLVSANAPTSPQWNSSATASREANPSAFTLYDVSSKLASLRMGRNVLAVQGLNDSVNSSDMIILPELYGGKVTPATTLEPKIHFGQIEANPASGNQNEEFVQLLNPHSIAVDISGWKLSGGIEHTFLGGTVMPPEGALYVCPNAAAFRARTVSPKGGEGLLVQGGYKKHLSNFGENLVLLDASGATNNTATYPAQPSDPQRYLVVSELMYHPSGDGLAEFIELLNISSSVPLNLQGVRFTQGVDFDFTGSPITSLPPGERVLIVRDLLAFQKAYGTNLPVAGTFANGSALSNSGEAVKIEDASQGTIQEFAYDDQAPWPVDTDDGYSLVLINPESNPDHALAANWRAGTQPGGSPGRSDAGRFPFNPSGDANGNGERDLIDYVLGNDLGLPPISAKLSVQPNPMGGPAILKLSYPSSLSAVGAEIGVFFSTDLIRWQDAGPYLDLISRDPLDDGRELLNWRVALPLRSESQAFIQLRATPR